MSMFTITVFGDKRAATRFQNIALKAANARPAFEEIYRAILEINQETFDTQGARGGKKKWAKLSIDQVIYKAKKQLDPKILHMTHKLRDSMTTYRSPDAYTKIEKERIIFQPKLTAQPGARLLFKGGHTGGAARGAMPARPFIRFTEQDAQGFGREIARHLMSQKGRGRIGVNIND